MNTTSLVLRSLLVLGLVGVVGCGDGGDGSPRDGATDGSSHDGAHADGSSLDGSDGASGMDASDGASNRDGTGLDGSEASVVCGCGPTEVCGDGFDNNCDGRVDENCPCLPGTTQRCLNGTPQPGAPLCAYGEQTCTGDGEFGQWSACANMGSMADASGSAYACRRILVLGAPGANPSSNFQGWLQGNGAIVTRAQTAASDGPLRRELLDTFDVVIIDWLVRDYTADESTILRDWVVAGGGLISMSGHDSGATADRQVSLLQSVGMTYQLGQAYNGPATFVSSPVSTIPGSSRVLGPVTFNGGMQVVTTSAFTGTSMAVATVPGGTVVGMTGNLGHGNLFVFGDEWIEFDSEWATMPDIQQLWFNSVNWVNANPGHAPMVDCE